jgi:hypothetical protein
MGWEFHAPAVFNSKYNFSVLKDSRSVCLFIAFCDESASDAQSVFQTPESDSCISRHKGFVQNAIHCTGKNLFFIFDKWMKDGAMRLLGWL